MPVERTSIAAEAAPRLPRCPFWPRCPDWPAACEDWGAEFPPQFETAKTAQSKPMDDNGR